VSEEGNVAKTFGYSYDVAGNRLTEQVDATIRQFSYNTLNELTTVEGDVRLDTAYQWDAEHRLISITSGNHRTEFTYDGLGQRVGIRQAVNEAEVSNRRLVWCDDEIFEERTGAGAVAKRFFQQGVKVERGATAGDYYYARDHLGSIHELTDSGGNIRARYSYDPFGRRTLLTGNVDGDFGFAGMFRADEASLNLTKFRAYDPGIGRWLSRDLLDNAEIAEGINLFAYVRNNPVNLTDVLGAQIDTDLAECERRCGDCPDGKFYKLLAAFCKKRCWFFDIPCKTRCDIGAIDRENSCLSKLIKCLEECHKPPPCHDRCWKTNPS
jgi:RHS repeat-associated protein